MVHGVLVVTYTGTETESSLEFLLAHHTNAGLMDGVAPDIRFSPYDIPLFAHTVPPLLKNRLCDKII